mgnify:CR=1 FL=1
MSNKTKITRNENMNENEKNIGTELSDEALAQIFSIKIHLPTLSYFSRYSLRSNAPPPIKTTHPVLRSIPLSLKVPRMS